MRAFLLFFAAAFLICLPAKAQQNNTQTDCTSEYHTMLANPLLVARAMADFKAGFDAGYDACEKHLTNGDTSTIRDAWRRSTDKEIDTAHKIIDRWLLEKMPQHCSVEDESYMTVLEQSHTAIDMQYQKAYDRQIKSVGDFAKLSEDQVIETCTAFQESVIPYYKDNPALNNILFTIAKKHNSYVHNLDWERSRAFKQYEKALKSIHNE